MRLAIISDTHLPRRGRELPAACLEQLAAADAIMHAGDFIEASVLHELQSLGPPVHAVHGNIDSPDLRAMIPRTVMVQAEDARIALIHDGGPVAGRLERLRRTFSEADAAVFGHSHVPLHEVGEGFQIFNPGSPTDRRKAPRHTMGIATVADGRVTFELVELD